MDIDQSCCILCFEIIEFKKNSEPEHKYYDKKYKQTLFDCCNRLLGVQIESLNSKFSVINCSPFCLSCFQSTEELWQIEEKTRKTDNKKELNNYVETFTGKILQCRLSALSKNLSSGENNISDFEDPNEDLSFDQLDDNIESNNDTEIRLEIVKDEVDYIEETFALENGPADWNDGVDDVSTSEIFPTGANKQCSGEKSSNKLAEIKSNPSLPELRVLLERLQFDNEGNVLQKMYTNKRLRNKNQVIDEQTSILVENSSFGKRCRRSKTEQTLRYRDDSDRNFEYSEEDPNSDSAESEDGKVMTQSRNSKRKVKTHLRRRKRSSLKKGMTKKNSGHINDRNWDEESDLGDMERELESGSGYEIDGRIKFQRLQNKFQCDVCSSEFTLSTKFQDHMKKTGHVNIPSLQCSKCSKKFYNATHLKTHELNVHEVYSKVCPKCKREITTGRYKFMSHVKHCQNVDPQMSRVFSCAECQIHFPSRGKLLDHMNTHSSETLKKQFKCDQCEASFIWPVYLDRHKADHLVATNIQCQICFYFYKSEDSFQRHMRTQHNRMDCSLCDRNFQNFDHVIAHQISDHGMQSPFLCRHCKKTFHYKSDWRFHLKSIHGEKPIGYDKPTSCDFCGKVYKGSANLTVHLFSHTNFPMEFIKENIKTRSRVYSVKGTYPCKDCGKVFSLKYTLESHRRDSHSNKEKLSFSCEDCGKTFAQKTLLYRHMKRHQSDSGTTAKIQKPNLKKSNEQLLSSSLMSKKKYTKTPKVTVKNKSVQILSSSNTINNEKEEENIECNLCETKFKIFQDLIAHQISDHGMQSPFLCRHCKKTFHCTSDWRLHLKSVHNEIPSRHDKQKSCDFCGKEYIGSKSLLLHLFSHTNFSVELIKKYLLPTSVLNGSFQCKDCGRSFATIYTLRRHGKENNSEGSKEGGNFPCQECDKIFSFKCALNRHLRLVHSSTDYVECNICGKNVDSRNLKRHLREHKKRFFCDVCGEGFGTTERLKRHVRRNHEQNEKPKKRVSKRTSNRKFRKQNNKKLLPKLIIQKTEIKSLDVIESLSNNNTHTLDNSCLKSLPHSSATNTESTKISRETNKVPCHICGSQIDHTKIKRHLIEHVKQFVCDICGCRFGKRIDLKSHIQRIHQQNKKPKISWWKKMDKSVTWAYLASKSKLKRKCKMPNRNRKYNGKVQLKITVPCKQITANEKNLESDSKTNIELHPNEILKDVIESVSEENNFLGPLQQYSAINTNSEPTFEELYDEDAFDDTYFEADNIDCDDDINDSQIPCEYPSKQDSFKIETPNVDEPFNKSSNNLGESRFRELRVLVERLQFDSEGNVIQQTHINTDRRLRKRKAAILARTNLAADIKEECLSENEEIRSSRDEDWDFPVRDMDLDSTGSNDIDDDWKSSGQKNIIRSSCGTSKRRRSGPRDKYQRRNIKPTIIKKRRVSAEFKCSVCLLTFKSTNKRGFLAHLELTSHVSVKSFECQKCHKCHHRLQDLQAHEKKVHDSGVIICPICEKKCGNNFIFQRHYKSHNEGKPFKCDKCKATFFGKRKLLSHKKQHLVETNVQCDICYLFYQDQRSLRCHIYTSHKLQYRMLEKDCRKNRSSFKCDKCEATFSGEKRFLSHKKRHFETNFQCDICHLFYENQRTLLSHIYTKHKLQNRVSEEDFKKIKGPFKCDKCEATFSGKRKLFSHKKQHETDFQCDICYLFHKNQNSLRCHMFNEHKLRMRSRLKCDKCKATFPSELKLLSHKEDHLVETNVQCDICYLFYKTQDSLNFHVYTTHKLKCKNADTERVNGTTLVCDSCSKIFTTTPKFIAHQISEHGMQSPFNCKLCTESFNYGYMLSAHLKSVHNQTLDTTCHCGKHYRNESYFFNHMLKHTNAYQSIYQKIRVPDAKGNFPCQDCGKMYYVKRSLKLHWERNHAPDASNRAIMCKICEKIIPDALAFRRHMAIHEKSFQCELCGRNFSVIASLEGHIRRIHEQNKTPRKSYSRTPFPKKRCDL